MICLSSHVGDLFHLPVMAVRRQTRCLCMPSAAQNHPGRKNYLPPAVMRPETTLHTVQVRRLSRALGSPRLVQCFRSFGSFWEDWFQSRLCRKEPNTRKTLTTPVRTDPASRNWNLELEVAPGLPRSFGCFRNWPFHCFAETINSNQLCRTTQVSNGPRRLLFKFRETLIHLSRFTPTFTVNKFMILYQPARSAIILRIR